MQYNLYMPIGKKSKNSIEQFIEDYVKYIYSPSGLFPNEENLETLIHNVSIEHQPTLVNLRKWYVAYNRGCDGFTDMLKILIQYKRDKEQADYQDIAQKAYARIGEIKDGKFDDKCMEYYRLNFLRENSSFYRDFDVLNDIANGVGGFFQPLPADLKKDIEKAVLQRGDFVYNQKQERLQQERLEKLRAEEEMRVQRRNEAREQEERARKAKEWWKN